ncbi:trichohyalin [Parambassis ranga]|uniref:Trichohyalin n=1 Tax=Parambassis ranga TaxID=210632 RepID=A0A6P7JGF1_9TELE|nr:leucine-, glutamate- and lysine-rich protein 1 [Parambassis ranga]
MEDPTEAKQVKEKELNKVLHRPPIYPLPEEIKKMDHSETVCFYCGVSYLIFHEFDKLHTQVVQLETELQTLREDAQREKAQLEAHELGRLEWERALRLEVQRQAELRERSTREELEERNRENARALRDEFEAQYERKRRELEVEYQTIYEEEKRLLTGELEELEAEKLRKQREELEERAEERERVLSDAQQNANKKIEELRKHQQQLEERLAMEAAMKEDVEQVLGKEKHRGEILRGVCVRQQQALRETLSSLRSSGSELTDVRGFLSQLTGAWQVFKSQILQESTQVFSALSEKLQHSSVELQKTREEKQHLTQQLMEHKRQREEQLCQQEDSERELRGELLSLKAELEEKHKRWLSCQQRCDAMQEQLSSWDQKGEQMNQKYSAAAEEVRQLRKALQKIQQEMRELRREREILIESHGRTLTKMKEDHKQQLAAKLATALEEHRSQSALHQQMEELQRQAELEQTINRGKHQVLLLQCQKDCSQLQQKLEERHLELNELQEELQQERRRREEERRRRREEETQRQEARELMTVKNAELQEEVALLQETVRRECEEREELTAALCQAQKELCGLRSPASHPGTSRPLLDPTGRRPPPENENLRLHSQTRVAFTRFSTSPNTLQSPTDFTDKDRGQATGGGRTERTLEALDGENRGGGALSRLRASRAEGKIKRTVRLMMERKEKL